MKGEFELISEPRRIRGISKNYLIMYNDAQVYVGTYGKYNDGSLFGKWLTISDFIDKDEFIEACLKLHSDEDDPELMFQDWQGIPDTMIGESFISEVLFDFCSLDVLDEDEEEAFEIWIDNEHIDVDREDAALLIDRFKDVYEGKFESKEDFAYYDIEELHPIQDEFLKEFFNYQKYADRLFETEFYFDSGFVFRNL